MSLIQKYVKSKGTKIEDTLDDFSSLMLCLKDEYGFIAPVFKNCSQVSLIELAINLEYFAVHSAYLERVEPRNPEKPEFIGVVVQHENKYRLIDGYHRFKWAINNREKGLFILVE